MKVNKDNTLETPDEVERCLRVRAELDSHFITIEGALEHLKELEKKARKSVTKRTTVAAQARVQTEMPSRAIRAAPVNPPESEPSGQ